MVVERRWNGGTTWVSWGGKGQPSYYLWNSEEPGCMERLAWRAGACHLYTPCPYVPVTLTLAHWQGAVCLPFRRAAGR